MSIRDFPFGFRGIVYRLVVADTDPIPVRLEKSVIARLDKVAAKIGNNRTGVIRLCLMTFLDYFEEHGSVSLPVDWPGILKAQDGRTKESRGLAYPRPSPAPISPHDQTNKDTAKLVGALEPKVDRERKRKP